jgi:hypothetical protein
MERTFRVITYQAAFQDGPAPLIREVLVPYALVAIGDPRGDEGLLENVYQFGQNEIQPVPDRHSISAGDVIELGKGEDRRWYRVKGLGFEEIKADDPFVRHLFAGERLIYDGGINPNKACIDDVPGAVCSDCGALPALGDGDTLCHVCRKFEIWCAEQG